MCIMSATIGGANVGRLDPCVVVRLHGRVCNCFVGNMIWLLEAIVVVNVGLKCADRALAQVPAHATLAG